ncbi:hypothetical protein B0T25DRAFT_570937 [Lasiosphaeria hispida]|uniref:Uncharacterized protein n=1 Tax=Lasiosphaeria hispida TaxID=260671 RepID=A0AAJ0HAJ2_9PEZI|nr:hypothetical protein B0T25DRAFT_570937 [Lasiosphaeria hispida]
MRTQREATLSYAGAATLVDTRVVCVRPSISDIQIRGEWYAGDAKLSGNIWIDHQVPGIYSPIPVERSMFDCRFAVSPDPRLSQSKELAMSLCAVRFWNTGLISETRAADSKRLPSAETR